MESAVEKTVLVSFGESRRVITVPHAASMNEHEFLLKACRSEFCELLPDLHDADAYTLTLQARDEVWGGVFVDYKQKSVLNKAVFKLIAVPRMVSNLN